MSMSPYVASIRARIGNAMLLMPSVTAAVIHEGRLLLARHVEDEVWSFVGGSVEPDEEPAAAALRELTEETGLVGELLGIVGCYGGPDYRITYANGDVVAFVDTVYACRLLAGEVHLEEAEISEIGWFDHTKSRPRHQPPTTRTPTDSCGQTAGSANSGNLGIHSSSSGCSPERGKSVPNDGVRSFDVYSR